MKQRIIGGTLFVILFYLSVLFDFFPVLALVFLTVGTYEIIKALFTTDESSAKLYLFAYFILYSYGIYTMYLIDRSSSIALGVIIGLVMLNDTFAYLVGRKFGKTKFSKISPNKTIEGAIGGIVCSFLIYLVYLNIPGSVSLFEMKGIYVVIAYILVMIFAIFGDLAESKVKRNANIKDSGTIVYGHGGILDRIDSWVFATIILNLFF